MPGCVVHGIAGATSGFSVGLVGKRQLADGALHLELAGGLIGGYLGGRAPDWIEPATHWNHLAQAHIWAAGALVICGVILLYFLALAVLRSRKTADEGAPQKSLPPFARGLLKGFPAGYLSHLALDARTRMGVPLMR